MTDDPFDLEGRVFDRVSSTASRVDPEAQTRFRYHEARGVVHVLVADGIRVTGSATSRVEVGADGLRLVEDFEADGAPQVGVCAEVRSTG